MIDFQNRNPQENIPHRNVDGKIPPSLTCQDGCDFNLKALFPFPSLFALLQFDLHCILFVHSSRNAGGKGNIYLFIYLWEQLSSPWVYSFQFSSTLDMNVVGKINICCLMHEGTPTIGLVVLGFLPSDAEGMIMCFQVRKENNMVWYGMHNCIGSQNALFWNKAVLQCHTLPSPPKNASLWIQILWPGILHSFCYCPIHPNGCLIMSKHKIQLLHN